MAKKGKVEIDENQEINDIDMNEENAAANADALAQAKEELELAKDKYTRLFAEFDNFKKRTAKERLELLTTASMEVIVSMLTVLDDFERALNAATSEDDKVGFQLVYNKLKHNLDIKGLKGLDTQVGEEFDVEFHEAITSIPAVDESQKGKIVDVIEKGYKLGDKVIRYTKVVIGE